MKYHICITKSGMLRLMLKVGLEKVLPEYLRQHGTKIACEANDWQYGINIEELIHDALDAGAIDLFKREYGDGLAAVEAICAVPTTCIPSEGCDNYDETGHCKGHEEA